MRRARIPTRIIVALVLCGCGGGEGAAPTGPAESDLRIAIVSGDGQRAPIGSSLSEFLVVGVSVGVMGPAEGVPVEWSVVEGGGELSLKGARTDRQGLAAAVLFVGDRPGEQVVRAGLENGAEVRFTALASNDPPPQTP